MKKAFGIIEQKENLLKKEELMKKNPKLYEILSNNEKDLLAMEVLTLHHKQAVTTGNSRESHKCR